jgi:integrase/ribosomal protein L40E
MTYIQEATIQAERLIKTIDADTQISKETKKITAEYVNFLQAQGRNDRTITKRLYCLAVFYKTIGNADVSKLSKEDIIRSVASIEKSKYAQTTKQDIKISIKALLKHVNGDDEFYPPEVRWLKASMGSYKKILPEDILTEDDVLKVMDVITDIRDKAIVSLLYDGGLRIGELLTLRVKDVDLTKDPAHVKVRGKTGERQVPVFFASSYLGTYLNTYKNRDPNSPLWLARGRWSNTNKSIDRQAVAKLLNIASKKAGITKPVNPHAWRKASATRYANSLSDQQLKTFYGWTPSSRMPEVYISLSGKNIDSAVMKANGVKAEETVQETKLIPKICPKCRTPNGTDIIYCGRCGSALDITTALEMQNKETSMKQAIAEALKDPKAIEEIVHAYLLMQAKKKGNR